MLNFSDDVKKLDNLGGDGDIPSLVDLLIDINFWHRLTDLHLSKLIMTKVNF